LTRPKYEVGCRKNQRSGGTGARDPLRFGRGVERDIEDLREFIAQDSIDAANRIVAKLLEAFEGLARNPEMGHKREDLTKLPVVFWRVGNCLFGHPVPSQNQIRKQANLSS
jgi:hypothetical protein